MKVELDRLNVTVEFDESKPIAGSVNGEAVEMYITDDNRLVTYDDASNMWCQLWPGSSRADALSHIND